MRQAIGEGRTRRFFPAPILHDPGTFGYAESGAAPPPNPCVDHRGPTDSQSALTPNIAARTPTAEAVRIHRPPTVPSDHPWRDTREGGEASATLTHAPCSGDAATCGEGRRPNHTSYPITQAHREEGRPGMSPSRPIDYEPTSFKRSPEPAPP
jgi:hypothetical protein